MKTLFIVLSLLFGGACITKAFADDEIILQIIDPGEFGHGGIKSPPMVLVVTQNYNILTLSSTQEDYMLQLREVNGTVVYSCYIPAGTTQIILPTSLSGSFEVRLITDTYYYIGYIVL